MSDLSELAKQVVARASYLKKELDSIEASGFSPIQAVVLMGVEALRDLVAVQSRAATSANYSSFVEDVVLKDGTTIDSAHACMIGRELVIEVSDASGKRVIPFRLVDSMKEVRNQELIERGARELLARG